jgi:hypothetical protein
LIGSSFNTIKLVGTKENIEQAIAELESNIQYDNLEVEIY